MPGQQLALGLADSANLKPGDDTPSSPGPRRLGWAKLLARVFAIDVTVCRKCGGRMRVLEVVDTADDIARVRATIQFAVSRRHACTPATRRAPLVGLEVRRDGVCRQPRGPPLVSRRLPLLSRLYLRRPPLVPRRLSLLDAGSGEAMS